MCKLTFQIATKFLIVTVMTTCLIADIAQAEPQNPYPLEPPDTSSPRATLETFLLGMDEVSRIFTIFMKEYQKEPGLYPSAMNQKKTDQMNLLFKKTYRCFDLSDVPQSLQEKVLLESTLYLKEVVDRIELPALKDVPDAAPMEEAESYKWSIPHTEITIERVKEGPRAGEYLFSPDTITRLPEFYQKAQQLPYKPGAWKGVFTFYSNIGKSTIPWKLTAGLPDWAKYQVGGQATWRWITFGASLVLVFLGLLGVHRWVKKNMETNLLHHYLRRIVTPIYMMLTFSSLIWMVDVINMIGLTHHILRTGLGVGFFLALAWTIWLLGNIAAEFMVRSPRIRAQSVDAAVSRLGLRILSLVVASMVVMYGAHVLGLPVVPLVAGLGVGGLALALAAQPTIENFIAGLTLYADRPVRVGEFIGFGGNHGIVEEIGMRSTRIRTLDNSLVSVPNAVFSKLQLENLSARQKIWFHPRLRLQYKTTPDQIRFILVEVRKLLYGHPKVLEDPARLRFVGFGEFSLDLDVFAYIDVTDYGEYLAIAEDLNLRIMAIIAEAGTELAVPSRVEYQVPKEPLDPDRVRQTEDRVNAWRSEQALYLPKFPPEKIAELRDSIEYPPSGSPDSTHPPTKGS